MDQLVITSTDSHNKRTTCSSVRAAVASAAKKCLDRPFHSQNDQHQELSRGRQKVVLLILFAVFILAFILFMVFISYLQSLGPDLPRFLVDSASFSKLNLKTSTLNATCLVSLHVVNPNANHSVSYDRFYAAVTYGGASNPPLDVAQVPPFHQGRLQESIIRFQFELVNEYVGEEVVRGIISNAGGREYVDLGVQVKARIEFEGSNIGERGRSIGELHLKFYCDPVRFELWSQNGTRSTMGPSNECKTKDKFW